MFFEQISIFWILVISCVISLLILILREIITWYWKINKVISVLEKIELNTSYLFKIGKLSIEQNTAGSVVQEARRIIGNEKIPQK